MIVCRSLLKSRLVSFVRPCSSLRNRHSDPDQYFVTTPIFYVNAEPHIGHLHSVLLADALHRFHILKGCRKTVFSTGTDEYGLKIQKAASHQKLAPQEFCDKISNSFRKLTTTFGTSNTHFIRTTEERHGKVVEALWKELMNRGLIYKSKYEGWYCVSDETFTTQVEDVHRDGQTVKISSESGNPVEWYQEENYMFKMSEFTERILGWLEENSQVIKPKIFYDLTKHWVSQGLQDLSISRPRNRLEWGIQVPDDDTQTVYVWFDALLNYLTAARYLEGYKFIWPPDTQVLGKDILKFHTIYWPSFLMAAELDLPKSFLVHSHWTIDDQKMSKSKGNVVDPFVVSETFGPEALRYYLLREAVPHHDGSFSLEMMKRRLDNELADTMGNLLSRCCAPKVNPTQIYPRSPHPERFQMDSSKVLVGLLDGVNEKVSKAYESGNLHQAVDHVMESLRAANEYFTREKPWLLVKKHASCEQRFSILFMCFEALRISSILLSPIIPMTTKRVLDKLNITKNKRTWKSATLYRTETSEYFLTDGNCILYQKI